MALLENYNRDVVITQKLCEPVRGSEVEPKLTAAISKDSNLNSMSLLVILTATTL